MTDDCEGVVKPQDVCCDVCNRQRDCWYTPHGGWIEFICWECAGCKDANTPPECPFLSQGESCDVCGDLP